MSTTADTLAQLVNNTDQLLQTVTQVKQTFEQSKADAEAAAATSTTQAGISTAQATESSNQRLLAQQAKDQTDAIKSAVETLKDQTQAIALSGDVSYDPAANQAPLARSNGKIDPQWIQGAAYPGNAVDTSGAVTGALIPDNTQYAFTPAMARLFDVFIPETLTREIIVYEDGVQGIYITTDRKIRLNCYGVYETTARLPVYGDYVTIQLDRNDNQADTVTVFFMVNGLLFDTVKVSAFSDLYVRNLLNSTSGFLLLVSPGHSTLTNAGVAKVENPGDAIGLLRDLGPNGINAAQATATARPLLGRVPVGGRRNLCTYTEDLTNSVWEKTGVTVDPEPVLAYDGTKTAWVVREDTSTGPHRIARSGTTGNTRSTVEVKAFGRTEFDLSFYWNNGPLVGSFVVNLTDGTVISNSSNSFPVVEPLPDGWLRIGTGRDGMNGGNTTIYFEMSNAGNQSYTGDGKSGLLIRHPQYELNAHTDYQRVGATARDVTEPGVQDCYYAYFDGSDDILPFTVPAITDGTIILAGTKGIWIDSLTVSAGTFNLGPKTYTGGPGGILALVGDVIGMFIIGRAITAGEQTALINYFKGKGAPGYFEFDANLATNGTFDADTNWDDVDVGTGTSQISGGVLSVTGTDTSNRGIRRQAIATVANEFYFMEVESSISSGTLAMLANATSTFANSILGSTSAAISPAAFAFKAVGTTTYAFLYASGAGDGDFDNFTFRKITLNTGA